MRDVGHRVAAARCRPTAVGDLQRARSRRCRCGRPRAAAPGSGSAGRRARPWRAPRRCRRSWRRARSRRSARVVTPSRAASSSRGRDLQLGPRQRALGRDVGEQRIAAQRALEPGDGGVQVRLVCREDAEGQVALAAVVELEDAHVRDRRRARRRSPARSAACGRTRPCGSSFGHEARRRPAPSARPRRRPCARSEWSSLSSSTVTEARRMSRSPVGELPPSTKTSRRRRCPRSPACTCARRAVGVGQRRARRQLDADRHAADVLGRDEAARDAQHEEERDRQHADRGEQRQVAHAQRAADQAEIAAHDPAVARPPRRAASLSRIR